MSNETLRKIIVITGASSGFGKGAARRLAEGKNTVLLAARRGKLLTELAKECIALGGEAMAVATDVSKQAQVETLAQAAIGKYGRIDVWINDAGVGAIGRFEEIPLADHEQVIKTNLLGTIYGSYFAMKQFKVQQSGILINIASALGKIPSPYYGSYSASKFGVVGLSAALRQELDQDKLENIKVCTVMPMANDTPFFEHAANYTGHKAVPIPPLYNADEVVDTICKLVDKPQDEVTVGGMGKMSVAAHAIMPGAVEKYMAANTHKTQLEKAPAAPITEGSVLEPVPTGTEVHAPVAVP